MRPSSTRTSPIVVNQLPKMKRVTYGSMEVLPTHNWSGRGKGIWCRRKRWEGKIWRLSRLLIMQHVHV